MTVKIMVFFLCLYAIWNLCTFAFMGIDKHRAVHHKQRISEKALLTSAFLMGGVGSVAGAFMFHHKTKKTKFKVLLPLAILSNIAVAAVIYRVTINW